MVEVNRKLPTPLNQGGLIYSMTSQSTRSFKLAHRSINAKKTKF